MLALPAIVILLSCGVACAGQAPDSHPALALPPAPQSQTQLQAAHPARSRPAKPCPPGNTHTGRTAAPAPATALRSGSQPVKQTTPCPSHLPIVNWYARFLDGPHVKPLTPKEKAWLATRNLGDPFNAITILGQSGIAVASDPSSPYGPGMPGFGRNVGVSYAEDATGEFFGTFLIPSIARQDPHYHRMPDASIKRRIAHAIFQVAWTQGDNGKQMVNYADLVGFAIDDEIANLYVPGEQTNLPSTAARYATGLATAPIDNFVTEFLPDIARHIHMRIVLVQRIINQVATTNNNATTD
ncbi:MAG: hypothetical protein ACLGRW_18705 [Acidobacteriota bacterium]